MKNVSRIILVCTSLCWSVLCAPTKFASHVRVTTPGHSFTHGVGDPFPNNQRSLPPIRNLRVPQETQAQFDGYPKQKPSIPFYADEAPRTWPRPHFPAEKIPLLPPSPYKVDSPDPESLWPEGLFLPPLRPTRLEIQRRSNIDDYSNPGYNGKEAHSIDPYLLEGSEAISAVVKAKRHGELYFHDIPHIQSLLSNQELRIQNNLEPHRLGSIRQTWPFNRL